MKGFIVYKKTFSTRFAEWFTIFLTGGMLYYFAEIAFRHYSHFSMIICGGLATLLCGGLNQVFRKMSVVTQMVVSSLVVTELEFLTGYIVNIKLNYGVWDYSELPLNLMGQICLPYSVLWMFVALLIMYVDDNIRCNLFSEEKPIYRLL